MTLSLPEDFVKRVGGQLGEELPAFLNSYEKPFYRGIRFNPMKSIPSDYECRYSELIPWADHAYYLSLESLAGVTLMHEAGAFYLQEPSAMIPASVMCAQPGEIILDLCAAPGGKSTQMGCAMKGSGLLISNEPVPKRAAILSRNIERLGIPNAIVTSAWPEQLADKWPEMFDGVMVDAPCSGEGMFRRHPESIREWSEKTAEGCSERQKEILNAAARLVIPGGRLVYSTCTLNPQENENNALWFVQNHPEFTLEPFTLSQIDGYSGMTVCWPHRMKGEGQFVALFRKNGALKTRRFGESALPLVGKDTALRVKELIGTESEELRLFGNTVVSVSSCPDLRGIRVLRAGLHLCEEKGKQIIPDHAAAMSFQKSFAPETELSGEEALRYMAGETFAAEGKGWVIASYRGLNLGWGKISDGILKNHYPKGLRNGQLIISEKKPIQEESCQ